MAIYSNFAKHYDELTKNIHYGKRARYFHEIIEKHKALDGKICLDLACGTGSMSVALAGLGYDVIGADGSAEMLSFAMSKSRGGMLFLKQKMWEIDLYGTVDITVCALDSLNHITERGKLKETFSRVSLFTNPNGLFIFDLNSLYKHEKILADNTFIYDCKNVYCVWQNCFNMEKGMTEIRLDFFEPENGRGKSPVRYTRTSELFYEKVWSHGDIVNLLCESGFSLDALYADDTFEPVNDCTERLIYVARKERT